MVGEKMGKGMGKKGRVSPFLFLTFFLLQIYPIGKEAHGSSHHMIIPLVIPHSLWQLFSGTSTQEENTPTLELGETKFNRTRH